VWTTLKTSAGLGSHAFVQPQARPMHLRCVSCIVNVSTCYRLGHAHETEQMSDQICAAHLQAPSCLKRPSIRAAKMASPSLTS
jgi:hypothetical protein